jgi:hypothetical protein
MPRFEFESKTIRWFYTMIFVSCGESWLLVSRCVDDRCDMASSDEDLGRSRRSSAGDWAWSSTGRVLSGRTIGRSGDTMCGLHHTQEDKESEFLGLGSKPSSMVCQWFDLKTSGMISPGLTSKPMTTACPGLASKPAALVW